MNRLMVIGLVAAMCGCGRSRTILGPQDLPVPIATLSGIVSEQTASGQSPLEGIEVTVTPPVRNSTGLTATTDANGFYKFASVPAVSSQVDVLVTSAAYGAVARRIKVDGETRFDVQLARRPLYTLSGVVSEMTPDGPVPIEGVRIDVFTCDGAISNCAVYQGVFTTTGSDGRYSLPGVWGGQQTAVWAFKAGYRVDGPSHADCDGCDRLITASADTQLDLQLVR